MAHDTPLKFQDHTLVMSNIQGVDENGDRKNVTIDTTGGLKTSQGNVISTTSFNSRDAATLAAGATFQGVGEDVSGYGRVGVAIISDNSTDGTLTIQVSQDNSTWKDFTRTWADTDRKSVV